MSEFISEEQLASYLQATITTGAAETIIELANGIVTDVLGEDYDPNTAPTRVKAIVLEVAARAWRNPQGYSSVTVGIDDYDKTVRREGSALERTGIYLTDNELAELLGLLDDVGPVRAGSIRLRLPFNGA